MHTPISISVVSWNCLADCYSRGTIVGKRRNSERFISWHSRSKRIGDILHQNDADVICLQEVDHYEDYYQPLLSSLRYQTVYAQRPGRDDGVLIAFKLDKFRIVQKHLVDFDDLARVKTHRISVSQREKLRKGNVAIILLLKSVSTKLSPDGSKECFFTVSTSHMYWNPMTPQIKLAQAIYLLERIADVKQDNGLPPAAVILTGDFNSLPGSQAYECVIRGTPFNSPSADGKNSAAERACSTAYTSIRDGSSVRFICDATLGRMARWLRLLGVDAALEDKHSQDRRSDCNDFSQLFEKARRERRIIVTTSKGMQKRASCPETFLVNPSKSENLENCLAALLNLYEVKLNKKDFLSICGKCGSKIEACGTNDARVSGKDIPTDKELFICINCHQVYWESNSMNGCSARAKRLAESLYSHVEAGRSRLLPAGGPFGGNGGDDSDDASDETSEGAMHLLNGESESFLNGDAPREARNGSGTLLPHWLRLKSVFYVLFGEEPKCTNINGSFRGTLDYVFVGGSCKVQKAEVQDHFQTKLKGHTKSFPNRDWPSDHILIKTEVLLITRVIGRLPFERTKSLLC